MTRPQRHLQGHLGKNPFPSEGSEKQDGRSQPSKGTARVAWRAITARWSPPKPHNAVSCVQAARPPPWAALLRLSQDVMSERQAQMCREPPVGINHFPHGTCLSVKLQTLMLL